MGSETRLRREFPAPARKRQPVGQRKADDQQDERNRDRQPQRERECLNNHGCGDAESVLLQDGRGLRATARNQKGLRRRLCFDAETLPATCCISGYASAGNSQYLPAAFIGGRQASDNAISPGLRISRLHELRCLADVLTRDEFRRRPCPSGRNAPAQPSPRGRREHAADWR